ncbi:uncharacterized protein DUF4235 [Stackebrandtia endophytica]|uniref:Uncharacterized protein DUF4235 n=1 Tax=Stackebrandtia endophytica TaxID=1496996 RepID=A0A543ATH4_9ACTN|nr:DUF4235 domain-containing protein [Stackebrandtia endophytica]TQL75887.1 uncharacterized protein DUF4235 [Stackebrandtia endophytica]
MNKLLYRPIGLGLGMVGGWLAGIVVKRVWSTASPQGGDPPDALDEDSTWREILAAAAIQGAVFATIKALFDRAGAAGVRRLTGSWPG